MEKLKLYKEIKKEAEFFLSKYDDENNLIEISGQLHFMRRFKKDFDADVFKPSQNSEVLIFYKYNRKPRLFKSNERFKEYMAKNHASFQRVFYIEDVKDPLRDYEFSVVFDN